jgi:hypothetical protein
MKTAAASLPDKRKPTLSFEFLPIGRIRPNPNNAREHGRKQIEKLKRSIERFGFVTPLVIDDTNQLLGGHGRLEAAEQLGYEVVPVVRASHLSESDKRAFALADNRLAELATWNQGAIRRELSFLSDLDVDFDFAAIGFDTAEVDFIIEGENEAGDRADTLPHAADLPPVTTVGDLWQLGKHRLYCGSALEKLSYDAVIAGDRAQMVFTDPPYNVPINGHVGGRGAIKHREFAMASGEMTAEQFLAFLATTACRIEEAACDGAICFMCMDWRHCQELHTSCSWLIPLAVAAQEIRDDLLVCLRHGFSDHVLRARFWVELHDHIDDAGGGPDVALKSLFIEAQENRLLPADAAGLPVFADRDFPVHQLGEVGSQIVRPLWPTARIARHTRLESTALGRVLRPELLVICHRTCLQQD